MSSAYHMVLLPLCQSTGPPTRSLWQRTHPFA